MPPSSRPGLARASRSRTRPSGRAARPTSAPRSRTAGRPPRAAAIVIIADDHPGADRPEPRVPREAWAPPDEDEQRDDRAPRGRARCRCAGTARSARSRQLGGAEVVARIEVRKVEIARNPSSARGAARRLATPAPRHQGYRCRTARTSHCASPSSPTSTRTYTRSRPSSRRSTPTRRTSCGASATSSATDRARTRCVAIVRERAAICLVGNHDLGVLGRLDLEEFSPDAAAARAGRETVLLDEHRVVPREPRARGEGRAGAELYHASPRDPVWEYVITEEAALEALEATVAPVVLVGHSHVALAITLVDGRARRRTRARRDRGRPRARRAGC